MNQQKVNELIDQARKSSQYLDLRTIVQKINESDNKFDKNKALDFIEDFQEGLTPNKVSELISIIGEHYQPKSIIDICCGIGNILSYFKNKKTIKGIDVNVGSIEMAQYINPNADFIIGDTLNYDFNNEKYDLVIGHFPFGVKIPERKLLEIELIDIGLKLLNINGVAIFVVADSILTSSNKYLSEFRKKLVTDFSLDMIISLPIGVFPYVGIKTSVLVVRKGDCKQDVYMPKFEDNSFELVEDFRQHKGNFYIRASKIIDRLDRNYYASLEEIEEIIRGHELIKLSDVSDIISGKHLESNIISSNGEYSIFNKNGKNFIDSIPDEKCILRANDIVVPLFNVESNNEVFIYEETNIKTVIPKAYAIIRPRKYKEYLATYLQTKDWKIIKLRYLKNTVLQELSINDLKKIEIPLLSNVELNELFLKTLKINNKTRYYILQSFNDIEDKEYSKAKENIEKAFENTDSEIMEHKEVHLKNIENIEQKQAANKALQAKEIELEDMMSMFAHKFRSPLDAIIYNTNHENNPKLYIEAAQTMRGLLDIFSLISTDDKILSQKIKADSHGNSNLSELFSNSLNMILLHFLSVSGTEKIRQHYISYAKSHGLCEANVSLKIWNEEYFELEQSLQAEWEQSYSTLLLESASLMQRLTWLEQHFFKLELQGFEENPIRFHKYATTESFLTIILSEILVNAFKYYSSESKQEVTLKWGSVNGYQELGCSNPSTRYARSRIKGSSKGHTFLSALAHKTGCEFNKPKLQDNFKVTFKIPNQLLITK